MHDEAVGHEVDERQRAQALEGLPGRLAGQQRPEQRQGGSARHRRGAERPPGRRVEALEVLPREAVDERAQVGPVVAGGPRPAAQGRAGQPQRQRVAVREQVDAGVQAGVAEQALGVGRGEAAERHLEQRVAVVGGPGAGRRGPPGHQDAGVDGQGRDEGVREPGVEDAQRLAGVEDEEDAVAVARERRRHGGVRGRTADRGPERRDEAVPGRLDPAAVEGHDPRPRGARVGADGLEQRGLAHPRHAMDDGRDRPVGPDEVQQRLALPVAADQGLGAIFEERSEGRRGAHARRRYACRRRASVGAAPPWTGGR